MSRSLEGIVRNILIAIFTFSFIVAAWVSATRIYLNERDECRKQMRSQVNIAQYLIADFIFGFDSQIQAIIRECPVGPISKIKSYLQRELHFHDRDNIYYLLDQMRHIIFISPPYDLYEGMYLAPQSSLKVLKVSNVHQSLFSDQSVVTIQYPLQGGLVLLAERNLQSIHHLMSFFDKSKLFDNQAIFILTDKGKVAFHPDTDLVRSRHNLAFDMQEWNLPALGGLISYQLYGKKYIALKKSLIVPKDWTIYFAIPADQLFPEIERAILGQLAMLLVFFAVIYCVMQWALNKYFSRPVHLIVQSLSHYKTHADSQEVVEPQLAFGVKELATIIAAINSMSAEIGSSTKKLRRSEEQIRLLLNSTAEAIYGIDTKGLCTFCNNSFLRMMGYESEEDVLGKNMCQLVHHPYSYGINMQENDCGSMKFLEGIVSHSDTEFFRKVDGTAFAVEYWMHPISQGEKIIGAVVTFIDITQRRETEERLAEEKEQLSVTLRSIGDAVITTDTRGNIVLLNRVAETLTGWSQREARGMPLMKVFNVISEFTRLPLENPVDTVLKTGSVVELPDYALLIAQDGVERVITDSGAPIRDSQSRIIGVVLVFRDVTESRKIQDEAFKARKLESIGVLAGGIAHDFNNILMAILGNLSLAKIMSTNGKQAVLLANAEKASVRAKGLTQQLLTFAKGGEPITETASISEVITESAGFVLHGSNVSCSFYIPDDLHLVSIDKGQISQVIQNIVINAKNAMPDGGRIKIICENFHNYSVNPIPLPEGDYVLIIIKDTGEGIPIENMDKIFDPYFTTSMHGQGLGLAVTRSIVTKHGGHVGVESIVGQGSTFSIYLPVAREGAVKIHSMEQNSLSTFSGRILVMDDEENVRSVVYAMLQQMGFEAFCVVNGQEMLEKYEEEMRQGRSIDVVILDLTIPGGMGGKEVVKKLLEKYPEARAVVSSGYYNDPVMVDCSRYGFRASVTKPFEFKELGQALSRALS